MKKKRTGIITAVVLAAAAAPGHAQDVLRIGTEGAYPPWNAIDASGDLIGFEIDLARELCARIERDCEFVVQDWDGMVLALLQRRFDAIMAGMLRTEERRDRIIFTYGYADTGASFATVAGTPLADLEALEDIIAALDGAAVGVQVGTTHQDFLEAEVPGVDIRLYDTQDQLTYDLVIGRIDAGLADVPAWLAFFETPDGDGYALFGPVLTGNDTPLFGEGVGIGLRQEDTELLAELNDALCTMANDGSLSALATDYFGYDTSMPCPN